MSSDSQGRGGTARCVSTRGIRQERARTPQTQGRAAGAIRVGNFERHRVNPLRFTQLGEVCSPGNEVGKGSPSPTGAKVLSLHREWRAEKSLKTSPEKQACSRMEQSEQERLWTAEELAKEISPMPRLQGVQLSRSADEPDGVLGVPQDGRRRRVPPRHQDVLGQVPVHGQPQEASARPLEDGGGDRVKVGAGWSDEGAEQGLPSDDRCWSHRGRHPLVP